MKVSLENIIPGTGKLSGIYRAVVEDNNDSQKRGRVRVRIFGIHTHILESGESCGVPKDHLPWAEPVLSTVEGSISGCGVWSVPVQGSHVFVFFESGNINQPRYFASSPGGAIKQKPSKRTGFSDPEEKYPLTDWLNEADFHRLARDEYNKTYVNEIKNDLVKIGTPGSDNSIEEPEPFYIDAPNEKYPNNIVFATHGGHVFEIDNTEDGKRFTYYHPSKTYLQISNDGDVIFRNKGDRYNLTDDKLYEYTKEDKTTVIGGDEKRSVLGNSTLYVKGDYKILSEEADSISIIGQGNLNMYNSLSQQFSSKDKQNMSCTGIQGFSARGSQSFDVFGNRSVNSKGNMSYSGLGRTSHFSLGWYDRALEAMCTKNTLGMDFEQSQAPLHIGSNTTTHIGRSPFQQATSVVKSNVDGITGAIREQMQPFYDAISKIQSEISESIGTALSDINSFLTPITEVIVDINNAIDFVKQEYEYAKEFVETVIDAPQQVIGAIVNQVQMISRIPGTLINGTLDQVNGAVSQITLLKEINKIYSVANDFGYDLPNALSYVYGGAEYLEQYSQYIDLDRYVSSGLSYTAYIDQYYPNGYDVTSGNYILDNYGRSGLSSYDGTTYVRKDLFGNDPVSTTGTLRTEMAEMANFVSDALSGSFISPSGDWLVEDTFERLRVSQEIYLNSVLVDDFTINSVLDPMSLSLPGQNTIIDANTINTTCPGSPSGYFVDDAIKGLIDDVNAAILAPYYESMEIYEDEMLIYDVDYAIYEIDYQAWRDAGSIPEDEPIPPDHPIEPEMPSTYTLDISINEMLALPPPTVEIENILIESKYTRIPNYCVAVTITIRDQLIEAFNSLTEFEDYFRVLTANIDYDKINWEGKYDDWPPSGADFSDIWDTTGIITELE